MTPTRHPHDDTLIAYAAGILDEFSSALVAAHIAACPLCRAATAVADAAGGVLLDAWPPTEMAPGSLAAALGRLNEEAPKSAMFSVPSWFPPALRRVLPGPYDDLAWRRVSLGVRAATLSPGGPKAQLLRAPPGTRLPLHAHGGHELTLVLKGSYTDELGTFSRNDVADIEGAVSHRPVIDPGEECVCLVVADAPLRLQGPILGRIQRLLGG